MTAIGFSLSVDHLLRQRQIKLGEGDGLHDRAEGLHRSLDLQFGRRAELQPFDVLGRMDRPHAVGDIAKAIVPVAQQYETLLFGQRRKPIHRRSVEDAKHERPAVEDERQHDRAESSVVFVELPLGRQPHIDRAELDLLGLLRGAAELVVGKDHHPDCAVGAFGDPARELLGRDIRRMVLLGEMGKPQRQRRRPARDMGRGQRRRGGGGSDELSAVHDVLPRKPVLAFEAA